MENKFKAGDKVKVIKGRIDYLVEGHIHKVSSIDDDLVVLVEHPDEFWHYSRFELVKPEVNQPESKVEFKYNDKVYQGVLLLGYSLNRTRVRSTLMCNTLFVTPMTNTTRKLVCNWLSPSQRLR